MKEMPIGLAHNRILTIVFTVFLISCFASTQPTKPRSEPDGFRGIKWGTEISTLKDMEKVEQNKSSKSDLVWYTRKGDTLAIGKAKAKNIFYSFWMGSFESVWIDFEGDENFESFKKELFERFGEVFESDGVMKETHRGARREPSPIKGVEGFYAWWGRNTELLLSYSKDRHKGNLSINSRKVREERRAYEEEKEKVKGKEF
jgi:hypothetical protein